MTENEADLIARGLVIAKCYKPTSPKMRKAKLRFVFDAQRALTQRATPAKRRWWKFKKDVKNAMR